MLNSNLFFLFSKGTFLILELNDERIKFFGG